MELEEVNLDVFIGIFIMINIYIHSKNYNEQK